MVTVIQSSVFKAWLNELTDDRARNRIVAKSIVTAYKATQHGKGKKG
jgi:putative component of toxin-antitoxin plasmid stabilization module